MGNNVLIISLGYSPAVVTETVDAMLEKGINLDTVYLVTTNNDVILNKCVPLLEKEFREYPEYRKRKIKLESYRCLLNNADIYDEKDNLELFRKIGIIMRSERKKKNNIYLSMAGGRKTMSAVMAVLAQIYGVRSITHVLVPPEIEKSGHISKLYGIDGEERRRLLHPDGKRLIMFPVIGVAWMLDDMVNILKGNTDIEVRKDIKMILRENNLIDDNFNPTESGKILLGILEEIEKAPSMSVKDPATKLNIGKDHHKPKGFRKFAEKLARNPYVDLISEIGLTSITATKIMSYSDDDYTIKLNYSDGSMGIEILVKTTARTSSELAFIKKELEEYISKI